ncbi:MAG: hypothetical protein Fur0018_12810 [Anaerolineales bacterium]
MTISRREFLKVMGGSTALLGLAALWAKAGPEATLTSEIFAITDLLEGQMVDSSATSDILYRNLRLHTLDERHVWPLADLHIAFLPDKTLMLRAAEALSVGALLFLLLERYTNTALLREPRLQAIQNLDAFLRQRWPAYRPLAPRLMRALASRPPLPQNVLLAAVGGASAAAAFGGLANIGIDALAARIGGTPIHGAIASRTVFESLAFIVLQDTYVAQARLTRYSAVKELYRSAEGRLEAALHTFEVEANPGAHKMYVHAVRVLHPQDCRPCYVHAADQTKEQGIAARLDLLTPDKGETHPLGHHYDPAVDWVAPQDADSLWARWRSAFLGMAVHNTPDGIGVCARDGRVLAFTPLAWASPSASNFGARVLCRRHLLPSEYNAFALKGAVWTPSLTAPWGDEALRRDLLDRLPLWRDLWCGETAIEFRPGDAATRRVLHITTEKIEVWPCEQAFERLISLAQRGDGPAMRELRTLNLLRGGPVVRPAEIPIGRLDDTNINDKSAINWMALDGGRIQGFVIGLQTARFDYDVEIPLVTEILQQAGIRWEYLVDCDEHTAGQMLLPAAPTWVRVHR